MKLGLMLATAALRYRRKVAVRHFLLAFMVSMILPTALGAALEGADPSALASKVRVLKQAGQSAALPDPSVGAAGALLDLSELDREPSAADAPPPRRRKPPINPERPAPEPATDELALIATPASLATATAASEALQQLKPTNVSIYPVGAPMPMADRAIVQLIPSADERMVTLVTGAQASQIHRLPSGTLVNPQTEVNAPDLSPADRQWLARQDRFSVPIRGTPRPRQPHDGNGAGEANTLAAPAAVSSRLLTAPLQPPAVDLAGQPAAPPWVYALAYYPQGDRLVTGSSDGMLRVWRLASQQLQGEAIAAHQGWVFAVAVDPAGQVIASAGNDGVIRFFAANTGEPRYPPIQVGGEVFALKFTSNGKQLFSSHQDGSIRLWDVASGRLTGGLAGHEKAVYALALTEDGKTLASAGADGSVRLWDALQGKPLTTLKPSGGVVYGLAFNPAGNVLASAGQDAQVDLWSLPSGAAKPYVYYTQGSALLSVAFSPDGQWLIAGSFDHKIWQWQFATGKPAADAPLGGHQGWVNAVAVNPNGNTFASASADGAVRLWKTDAPVGAPSAAAAATTPIVVTPAQPTEVVAVQPRSFNGAVVEQGTIVQYAASGQVEAAPLIHAATAPITALAYSSDGTLIIAGDQQGAFSLRSAKNGELLGQGQSHSAITALTLSADDRWLILGHDDGVVQLYYRDQAFAPAKQKPPRKPKTRVDTWVAAAGWSAVAAHQGAVRALALLPQGLVASGGDDQAIVLQRLDNGEAVGSPFAGHLTAIHALMPAEQGRSLYSAGADGSLQKWAVQP